MKHQQACKSCSSKECNRQIQIVHLNPRLLNSFGAYNTVGVWCTSVLLKCVKIAVDKVLMDRELAKKIKELEKAGFKVKKVVPTTKKTFEVPVDLVERFMTHCRVKDIKVKDAIAEALEEYLKKRG